jgi:hypothetical protein
MGLFFPQQTTVSIREFGQNTALRGPARTKAEEAETASCMPEDGQSLVKRTLFEVNSGARRPGNQNLTSAQIARLLLASSGSVKCEATISPLK